MVDPCRREGFSPDDDRRFVGCPLLDHLPNGELVQPHLGHRGTDVHPAGCARGAVGLWLQFDELALRGREVRVLEINGQPVRTESNHGQPLDQSLPCPQLDARFPEGDPGFIRDGDPTETLDLPGIAERQPVPGGAPVARLVDPDPARLDV